MEILILRAFALRGKSKFSLLENMDFLLIANTLNDIRSFIEGQKELEELARRHNRFKSVRLCIRKQDIDLISKTSIKLFAIFHLRRCEKVGLSLSRAERGRVKIYIVGRLSALFSVNKKFERLSEPK